MRGPERPFRWLDNNFEDFAMSDFTDALNWQVSLNISNVSFVKSFDQSCFLNIALTADEKQASSLVAVKMLLLFQLLLIVQLSRQKLSTVRYFYGNNI